MRVSCIDIDFRSGHGCRPEVGPEEVTASPGSSHRDSVRSHDDDPEKQPLTMSTQVVGKHSIENNIDNCIVPSDHPVVLDSPRFVGGEAPTSPHSSAAGVQFSPRWTGDKTSASEDDSSGLDYVSPCTGDEELDMAFLWDDVPARLVEAETCEPEITAEVALAMQTTGLKNLGNTCYMNSSLQCLANIPDLRDFFLTGLHKEALEVNGPGSERMAPGLAEGFASLLRHVWSSSASPWGVCPSSFKRLIGRVCDHFTGYAQHDAMEFVEFLLDGLKEDCNMVRGAKIVGHRIDAGGRPDKEVAIDAVNNLLMWNDSKIDDLLMGLFRNTTACPRQDCGHKSIVFDPFLSVKVSVPNGFHRPGWLVTLTAVPSASSGAAVQKCTVLVPEDGKVSDLIHAAAAEVDNLRWDRCELVEVFNAKVCMQFKPTDRLSAISACDVLVMYELENPKSTSVAVSSCPLLNRALTPGDLVMVKTCLQSNSKSKTVLRTGVVGRVVRIDAVGDACVKFDDIESSQWVFKKNHVHLAVVLRTDSDECREDPATGLWFSPSEYVEAFKKGYSCVELHAYWSSTMVLVERDPAKMEMDEAVEQGMAEGARCLEVFAHFACRANKASSRELFGFPLLLRARPSANATDLKELVRSELALRFGADVREAYSLFWARDARNLTKTREFLVGGTASENFTSLPSLYVVMEWEGKPPDEVVRVLAITEECGMTVGNHQEVALETCLELLTASEQLGEDDSVRCSACGHQCRVFKKLEFWSTPPVLTLQLNRFEYGERARCRLDVPVCFPVEGLDLSEACLSPDYETFPAYACFRAGQRVVIKGLQTEVEQELNGKEGRIMCFDSSHCQFCVSLNNGEDAPENWKSVGRENLKLTCVTPASKDALLPVYDLVAVSAHVGKAFFGHYVSYARSSEDGLWRLYNDDDVSEVTAQDVAAEKVGAYLLFYIRRDHRPLAWGTPTVADTSSERK